MNSEHEARQNSEHERQDPDGIGALLGKSRRLPLKLR